MQDWHVPFSCEDCVIMMIMAIAVGRRTEMP